MKRGAPQHPKTYELASLLGVRHVAAIGYLELLFHFTAQYAPRGDIGRYSDKRIAAGIEWPGSPGKLIESLARSGWIDRDDGLRLVVHDWRDHADRVTLQRLSRMGEIPIVQDQQDAYKVCTQSETNNRTPPRSSARGSGYGSVVAASQEQRKPTNSEVGSWAPNWDRFQGEYPGQIKPDRDCQVYLSVIQEAADEQRLFENLAFWKESKQWLSGKIESARNFLFDGQWKVKPAEMTRGDLVVEKLCKELNGY